VLLFSSSSDVELSSIFIIVPSPPNLPNFSRDGHPHRHPPPTSLEALSLAIFFLCASSRFRSILSNCSGVIFDLLAFDEADSSKLARRSPTSTFGLPASTSEDDRLWLIFENRAAIAHVDVWPAGIHLARRSPTSTFGLPASTSEDDRLWLIFETSAAIAHIDLWPAGIHIRGGRTLANDENAEADMSRLAWPSPRGAPAPVRAPSSPSPRKRCPTTERRPSRARLTHRRYVARPRRRDCGRGGRPPPS